MKNLGLTIQEKANRIADNEKAVKYADKLMKKENLTFKEATIITYDRFYKNK